MSQRLRFPLHIPFVETLGFELWAFGGGESELRLTVDPAHTNSWAVAHGGLVMTLMDVAMAHAARSPQHHEAEPGPGIATVEMKTSFLRPAEGELRCFGRLVHRTASLAFCEARVDNAAGEVCATASGTFKFIRKLPSGRSLRDLQTSPQENPT